MTEKERFIEELKKTDRAGVDRVIAGFEELGFFTAPASTRFHGSVPGGFFNHSLNVYDEALVIREGQLKFRPELTDDEILAIRSSPCSSRQAGLSRVF